MGSVPGTRADELASGPDDAGRRRSAPRWVWRMAGAAAAVVVAVLFGPGLLASPDGPRPSPQPSLLPSLPESRFRSADPRPPPPLEWPLRGDLGADTAFVAEALERVRQQDVAATKVLFASTLPDGGRIAFVALARSDPVSDLGRGVHMRALHVPPGVNVADATPTVIGRLLDAQDLSGWAGRGAGGRISLVVLGQPAPLLLEASPLIRYHRNGGATRRWVPVSGLDGSAVSDLGRRSDQIVAVRHAAVQARTYPLVLPVEGDPRQRAALPAPPASRVEGLLSPSYAGPSPRLVLEALAVGHEHRFRPAAADLRVVWSGEVEPARAAALIRARRDDGPVFQLLVVEMDGRAISFGPRHVRWRDADLIPWLFVQGERDHPVLLLNPSGRGTASITEAGSPARTVPIGPDGVAVFPGTAQGRMFTGLSGARLSVLSPRGEIVVSSSLPELGIDDVFVLR